MKDYSDSDRQSPNLDLMAALLEKADNQGFLTTDDIIEIMPDADEAVEQLEDIFIWLHAAGVEVFGDKPDDVDA